MLIQSWNCRGLGNETAISILNSFLRSCKPTILFLSETRLNERNSLRVCNSLNFQNYHYVPARGRSGGLMLLWKNSVELEVISASSNLLHCVIEGQFSTPRWELLCVYGPPAQQHRDNFWVRVSNLVTTINSPWCMIGDLNVLMYSHEKHGGSQATDISCHEFRNFTRDRDVVDLGFAGPAFTWSNNARQAMPILERLDRAISNSEWRILFPDAAVLHLPRIYSDHAPILLNTMRKLPKKERQYKFELFWTEHPQFMEEIQKSWDSTNGSTFTRLQDLGVKLLKWSRANFGHLSRELQMEKNKLLEVQSNAHLYDTREEEKTILMKIEVLLKREKMFWEQRNKSDWIPNTDKNTRSFHLSATHRKNKNNILAIKDGDGNWVADHEIIKSILVTHFQNVFTKDPAVSPLSFSLDNTNSLSQDDCSSLGAVPSPDEIFSTIKSIGSLRAPGPDGYPSVFYKKCWPIVGAEVIELVQNCFRFATITPGLNHSYLSLAPKVKHPSTPSDYRPIALCNVLYKVVTKILTIRLGPLLNNLIDQSQSAFIPGRQILDNIVIAKELIHSMNNSTSIIGSFALKLDMSKAYDRVDWNFLSHALRSFGITGSTHSLIMSCVTTATFSVLVNGHPEGFFAAERGIRQGCPLSPFLFIICSHSLSNLMHNMERQGLYAGYKLNRWAPSVSHTMFADDVMLYGTLNNSTIAAVQAILQQYYTMSGQQVNYGKSSIHFSKKVPQQRQMEVETTLGVRKMGCYEKYLGVQILQHGNSCASYNFLIEKMEKKLSGWKRHNLNHAGRTTLIQSALALIPVYYMATGLIPKGVIRKLNQIIRNFWWGHTKEKRKMHYLRWEWFTIVKEKGGLGLRSLEELNKALVAKLCWRFLQKPDAIWCKILKAKYMRDISFWAAKKPQKCSSTWSAMLSIREQLKQGCMWLIGSASEVRIWNDPWVAGLPGFTPSISPGSNRHLQFVRELLNEEGTSWNEGLVRQIFSSYEAEQVLSTYINRGESDKLLWIYTPHGDFSAQSFQKLLRDNSGEPSFLNDTSFPWKKFWSVKNLAPRILSFAWRIIHDGIGVSSKIGRFLDDVPTECSICGLESETTKHLLVLCHVSQAILFACPLTLRLQDTTDFTIKQLLASWLRVQDNNYTFNLGVCMLWAIWRGRNELVFEKKPFTVQSIIAHGMYWFNMYYYHEEETELYTSPTNRQATPINRDQPWCPPPDDIIKINVDAAWKCFSSSCAAVVRNCRGSFICAQSDTADRRSPLLAEASGYLMAIKMAAELGNKVIIEGDSKKVIQALNGDPSKVPWKLLPFLDQIKQVCSQLDQVEFSYVPREANQAAHLLAAHAFRHNIHQWWISSQPSCISSCLSSEEIPSTL